MKEFTVSYGYRTFTGMIGAGVMTFEADDIAEIKAIAFRYVINKLKEDAEDDDFDPWEHFENLSVSVKESD
jgi:hypothetical protein